MMLSLIFLPSSGVIVENRPHAVVDHCCGDTLIGLELSVVDSPYRALFMNRLYFLLHCCPERPYDLLASEVEVTCITSNLKL